jgi:hypothetical protein
MFLLLNRSADFDDDIAGGVEPRSAVRRHHSGALILFDDQRAGAELIAKRIARQYRCVAFAVLRAEID